MKPASPPINDDHAWFERWFNEDYLLVYPHRDQAEADRQVAAALTLVSPTCLDCLDLGCGSGRHARALSALGKRVSAIDLSLDLLRMASAGGKTGAKFIRSDIRQLPFRDHAFDLLTSFFTSFGYFADDHEHIATLSEWVRVLRPGGALFLDLPDRNATLERLEPVTVRTLKDGSTVTERRALSADSLRIEKSISIEGQQTTRRYQESVRLFTEEEILQLLDLGGFTDPRRMRGVESFSDRMVVLAAGGAR